MGPLKSRMPGIIRAVPPVEVLGVARLAAGWADVQAVTLSSAHAPQVVAAPEGLARRALSEIAPDGGVGVS